MIVGGNLFSMNRFDREYRFDAAGRTESVAGHRFGRTDGNVVGVFAKNLLDRQRFKLVVVRRRSSVSVDVADLFGRRCPRL